MIDNKSRLMNRKFGPMRKRARKGPAPSEARIAARVIKRMQRAVEKKVIDIAAGGYVCDTTGTVTLMNGVAQGTDFDDRIGRKYTNVTAQLQGSIQPLDTTTGPTHCRVMVIYDKQPNGALPAITDVLTASTSNAFMNLNNRDRFVVLCDHNVTIGGVSNTATQSFAQSPSVFTVNWYKAIKLETICDGITGGVGDINSGTIFLLTIGDQAPGQGGSFVGALRIRFTDQ